MTENCATEVLVQIFSFLKPVDLYKCRQVCSRWNLIVDSLVTKERFWRISCQRDFPDIYENAYRKRKSQLSWRYLYRSLSLWSKLCNATETRAEFASVSRSTGEIRDFHVLKGGEIGIQTKEAIIYYDIETLKQSNRPIISGNYLRYVENDNVILVLGTTSHLYIIRKVLRTPLQADTILPSVKTFIVNNDVVYYATLNNEIHMCELKQEEIKNNLLGQMDPVLCLGYKNGLHILTYERNIYSVIGTDIAFQHEVDEAPNLLHILNQYNLLENLDWREYFHWMFKLGHSIRGDLRNIMAVKVYGDTVLAGTGFGDLRIFQSPDFKMELDLSITEPVKRYRLSAPNSDSLEMGAVFKIDVIEGEDGHTVLVGMRKKIAVLNFSHNFNEVRSIEMLT